MKKLFALLFVFTVSLNVFAQQELIYDKQQIETEFKQLEKLESYVNAHEGITLKDVDTQFKLDESFSKLEKSSAIDSSQLPGRIPAFVWGCLFSAVGIILVYLFTNGDEKQTRQAFVGCVVTGVTVGAIYLISFIITAAAASAY